MWRACHGHCWRSTSVVGGGCHGDRGDVALVGRCGGCHR